MRDKEEKETIVHIILDAFRWDYINSQDTPAIFDMCSSGIWVKKLISSTGFTQRSAMFTGAQAIKTGNFTMFSFDPNNSPFNFLKPFSSIIKPFDNFRLISGGLRRIIYPLTKRYAVHAPTAAIPFDVLPCIGVTEDEKEINEPQSFSVESIFDIMHEEMVKFEYLMYPVIDGEDGLVLDKILEKSGEDVDIFFLQFSNSDLLCHKYGSESMKRHEIASEIDRKISILKKEFEECYGNVTFVLVGDHGMMDTPVSINVQEIVHGMAKQEGLKHRKDYLLFLDSTMARFWFFNEKSRKIIEDIIISKLLGMGKIIDKEMAEMYKIPYQDKKYGDLIWWANPGVLIYPDYFHKFEKYEAMHGYDSYHEKMKGFAIVYSKKMKHKEIPEAQLIDICPTLCDLLRIKCPKENEGRSFL